MKLANTLALLFTTASSLMLTAYADDEFATPALRAAAGAGSTHSSAASSVISSSFLKQADDIKAKLVVKKEKSKKIENEREGPDNDADDPYANSKFEGIKVKMVKSVESEGEWVELMEQSKEKLVVVYFFASVCGPCQMVAPDFEAMANENPNVIFVKVDVDAMDQLAQECGVRAVPTFQFFKGGEKVDDVMGANVEGLKRKVAALK